MAAEFRFRYTATGSTIYVVLSRGTDGQFYNGSGYEAPLTANWSTYKIALVEQSTTQFYYANMPATQAAGLYDYFVFLQAGGSPATTDSQIGVGRIDWKGAAEASLGKFTTGNTETLSLLALNIVNSAGDAIVASSTGGNGNGINISGSGSGNGVSILSGNGATAAGLSISVISTNGHAVQLAATGTGDGLHMAGGTSGNGLYCAGGPSGGDGIHAVAQGNNNGLSATGAGTGFGLLATGGSNGDGIRALGVGTGHGLAALSGGGATGNGIHAVSNATVGSGLGVAGSGTGHGISATSGMGATGDGIKAVAASTDGNGMTLVHSGTGFDLNATTTPPMLVGLEATSLDSIVVETGLNARQALSIIASSAAGVLAGATGPTVTIKGAGVATTRITATVDANGNRTAVVLNSPP